MTNRAKIAEIERRYADFNPLDIEQHNPLPPWQTVIEDIRYLLNLSNDIDEAILEGFNQGYDYAQAEPDSDLYEEGYEDGYTAGTDAANKAK